MPASANQRSSFKHHFENPPEIMTAESLIKTDSPSAVITSTTGTLLYPGTAAFTCAFIRLPTGIFRQDPRRPTNLKAFFGGTCLGDRIYFNVLIFKAIIIEKCSDFSTKWTSIITINFQFKSFDRRTSSFLWIDVYFWCFLLNNCTFCFYRLNITKFSTAFYGFGVSLAKDSALKNARKIFKTFLTKSDHFSK